MKSIEGLLMVMLRSAFILAFLSIPNTIVAFSGLKTWSRVAINKIDLCSKPSYSQILPGLYLSNARAATDPDVLKKLKITHVLSIEAHRASKSTYDNSNISTLFIRANDSPETHLLSYFPMANAFIDEGLQKGNVLVHCHFGVSRSATLVIAYIMEKYKFTFDQGFAFVKQRRKFINPNPGFINQLKEYERLNYDVDGFQRFEAFINVNAQRHKYKLASLAAVVVGVLVPLAVLVG